MLTTLIDALKAAGVDAYLPGRHDGKCKKAYAVVSDDGVRRAGKTTGRRLFTVTAYVPVSKPTAMNALLAKIRTAMAGLENISEMDSQSGDMIDDEIEAYIVGLEYSALCSMI